MKNFDTCNYRMTEEQQKYFYEIYGCDVYELTLEVERTIRNNPISELVKIYYAQVSCMTNIYDYDGLIEHYNFYGKNNMIDDVVDYTVGL